MSNPPVNTKDKCPLQGSGVSKIDRLGLGAIIKELKLSGMSDKSIVDELNESRKLTGANTLNVMGVWRWCKSNKINQARPLEQDDAVNIYRQECEMIDDINDALECVQYEISRYKDDINADRGDVKSMREISFTLEKLFQRKQALLESIGVMQQKVYTYNAVSEIVTTIMNSVKEHDLTLYATIKTKITENPMLKEAFRKIKEG